MQHISKAIFVLSIFAVGPAMAAQQYYISALAPPVTYSVNASYVISNGGNRISSSGVVSVGVASPETCPAGVTPNWTSIEANWSTVEPSIPVNEICFVEGVNSLGDSVLLAGDAYLVTHTGTVTNLTATYKIAVATGINTAGDIVGFSNYDALKSQFVLPGQDSGGGCSTANCHTVGVLLKSGTSSLVDLSTVLSANHATTESATQGLVWLATAINDAGQIVAFSVGNNPLPPSNLVGAWVPTFVLTPCTAGSCPSDAF